MRFLSYIFFLLFLHSLTLGQPAPFELKEGKDHRLEVVLSSIGTGLNRNFDLSKISTVCASDKIGFEFLLATNQLFYLHSKSKSIFSQNQQIKARSFSFYASGLSPPVA